MKYGSGCGAANAQKNAKLHEKRSGAKMTVSGNK
jgi:hypothetical protein